MTADIEPGSPLQGSSGEHKQPRLEHIRVADLTDKEQRVYESSGGNPWAVKRYRQQQNDATDDQ